MRRLCRLARVLREVLMLAKTRRALLKVCRKACRDLRQSIARVLIAGIFLRFYRGNCPLAPYKRLRSIHLNF
jgi:hypothetical protein